jgi:uncharacterized membrane protein
MNVYDRHEAVREGRVLLGTRVNYWAVLVATWKRALQVGLLVWFGFEAMAVAGSVLHAGYPLGLYLIHVGGALQATLVMALILGAWRGGDRRDVEIGPSASTSS